MSHGFVYALINASIPGLTKVGSTTRSLDERVRELSAATGVPTPFVVAYSEEFDDCLFGESETHRILEQEGYRLSHNREFFHAPLEDVIRAILAAKRSIQVSPELDAVPAATSESREATKSALCKQLVEEAVNLDVGIGCPPDAKAALRKYLKAHKLGCKGVCRSLAEMYLRGRGCRKDVEKARWFAQEGIREGFRRLHIVLVEIDMEAGFRYGAAGHWDDYFASVEMAGDWSQDEYQLAARCLRESYANCVPLLCRNRLRPVAAEVVGAFGGRLLAYPGAHFSRSDGVWVHLLNQIVAEMPPASSVSDDSSGFNVGTYWRENYASTSGWKAPTFEEFVRLALSID